MSPADSRAAINAILRLREFAREIAERRRRRGIAHRTYVAARRELHADAVRAPNFDTRIGYFEQEAGAIFN